MFYSSDVSDVFLQSIFQLDEKKKNSITIGESELVGMIMFNHKEESKLNSTITANSCAHTLIHDQIIKKVHTMRIT